MGLLFPNLFCSRNKVLAIGIEIDGALIPEHVGESDKLLWRRENLICNIITNECVIEIELFVWDAVPEIVVCNTFPSHKNLLSCRSIERNQAGEEHALKGRCLLEPL